MTNEEELTRLRMRVTELEKANAKERKKIDALDKRIVSLVKENAELTIGTSYNVHNFHRNR